jgi:hypothetical protein
VRAARRWLADHAAGYARLKPIYLGDDLFSRQPMCEAVLAEDCHFLFVCKPASHPLIQQYLTGVELPTHTVRVKRGREWVTHRYRWMPGVLLRGGKDALAVNWLEIEIHNPAGAITYRNSFITDLPVGRDNVAQLVSCGRARWKIENETFNVLKTSGYHIEHSFGHGKQNLPLCWSPSISWRSPATPSAIRPRPCGASPDPRSVHAPSSSATSPPSQLS